MPTTYPGDKTQTQAPSAPPTPEAQVSVELPVDGDPTSASTWEQAFKVLADFVDWLMKPQAKSLDWARATMAFRTAIGHKRFAIDHLGFPGGQVLAKEVVWQAGSIQSGTLDQLVGSMPEWRYRGLDSGPGTSAASFALLLGAVSSPYIQLQAAATINDYVAVTSGPYNGFLATNHIVLEVLAGIQTGHDDLEAVVGLGNYTSGGPSAIGVADFIGFVRRPGTNWLCITRNAGVETATDSGVAPTDPASSLTFDRLRVEWHGESVSDDGLRRVRFLVNGVVVQTHTANLPLGKSAMMIFGQQNLTGVAYTAVLYVGVGRYRANIFGADIAL